MRQKGIFDVRYRFRTYRDLGESSLLSAKLKVYASAMEPVPLKRVLFWTAYASGTLAFIFGLLLAQCRVESTIRLPLGSRDLGQLLLFPADLSFAVEKNLQC